MADYTVYDADDSGWPSGIGYSVWGKQQEWMEQVSLQEIFYIKIPGIKPVLLTALSVRIINAAKTFDIIWAMTEGGPNSSSETISIIIYKTLVKYNNTGYASAMAVIFIIVLVVFTLVFMQSLWNPKKK